MSEVPGDERVIAGRYRLLSLLGQGGMGVVWRARDEVLGREVAVKEVRAPSVLDTVDVRRLYARLEREAWAAARISHRNVVTVYDVATEDGRPWIVMELVRGLALSDVLDAEGPMTPQRAARIGTEVLAALRSAHEAGVLHRDVKPGNVLLANDGRVVLTDFGIASVEGTSHLTMTGELIGSPEFLAPERALGRNPGPGSDLWSLGVLLYAAVEGNSPFRQNTPLSTLRAVVDEELPPPRRADALAPVIEGLLRKDPADRLSAEEAERLLRVVGAGGTTRTTPAPSGAYAPTVTASTPATARPAAQSPSTPPPSTPPSGTTAATTAPHRGRSRRAALVPAAAVAVLLLALGGLTWAVVADDDPGNGAKGRGNSGSGSSAGNAEDATEGATGGTTGGTTGGGTPGPGSSTNDGSTGTDGGGGGGGGGGDDGGTGHTAGTDGGATTPPPQTVEVHVQAVRGSYSGTCPPPETEAPAFTASFTVGRTPATVDYRWATESGEGSDPGWKTLQFGAGDDRTTEVNHTELTYKPDQAHQDRIRVEVRSPLQVRSGWVEFSVTCVQETPTGGASYTANYAAN